MKQLPFQSKLDPLFEFDPATFCVLGSKQYAADGFILSLALIFNDLRDLEVMITYLSEVRPGHPATAKEANVLGNWLGTAGHFQRLRVGLIVEFLQLLRKAGPLLEEPLLQKTAARMGKSRHMTWKEQVDIATGKIKDAKLDYFRKALVRVRSHGGFHYDQMESLQNGYRFHFFQNQKSDDFVRARAYFCRGNNLQSSRFHFADAAVGAVSLKEIDYEGVHRDAVYHYLEVINTLCRFMVTNYLKVRGIKTSRSKDSNFANTKPRVQNTSEEIKTYSGLLQGGPLISTNP